jgi:hypothetical protein
MKVFLCKAILWQPFGEGKFYIKMGSLWGKKAVGNSCLGVLILDHLEKLDRRYLGFLSFTATLIWLR